MGQSQSQSITMKMEMEHLSYKEIPHSEINIQLSKNLQQKKQEYLKNSALMSVRAPVGEININPLERICVGRGLCSISLHNKQNEYLYYYLKSKQKLYRVKVLELFFIHQ